MSAFLRERLDAIAAALHGAPLATHTAPLRLVTVANGSRGLTMGALREQADKKKTQRQVGFAAGEKFRRAMVRPARFHVVVVTRISPRGLDPHDNLGAAMKAVIDGCATAIGIKDHDSRVRYVPSQEHGDVGEFSVRLQLFAAPGVDAAHGLHARHTDECIAHLTDPGATCVCRPPAVAEPLVGKLCLCDPSPFECGALCICAGCGCARRLADRVGESQKWRRALVQEALGPLLKPPPQLVKVGRPARAGELITTPNVVRPKR